VTNIVNCRSIGIITPRLLTKAQAAAYCGVSAATFEAVCDVRPVSLGNSKRLERFDTRELDLWIDSLVEGSGSYGRNWLATWEASNDPRSR
jgi:hypothetical protein